MKVEIKHNSLYFLYIFAFKNENTKLILFTNYDEACAEYITELQKKTNSLNKDYDHDTSVIDVGMWELSYKLGGNPLHGEFSPQLRYIQELDVFRHVKHFIKLPHSKDIGQ